MRFDHLTIVALDCSCLRDFFVDIAGLQEGARPAFGVHGYWLYLDQQPVLHLIERPLAPDHTGMHANPPPARIDHVALRIESGVAWQQLLQRLHSQQVPYQLSVIQALQEQQLFVMPVPGITVEFVIAARHLA